MCESLFDGCDDTSVFSVQSEHFIWGNVFSMPINEFRETNNFWLEAVVSVLFQPLILINDCCVLSSKNPKLGPRYVANCTC